MCDDGREREREKKKTTKGHVTREEMELWRQRPRSGNVIQKEEEETGLDI